MANDFENNNNDYMRNILMQHRRIKPRRIIANNNKITYSIQDYINLFFSFITYHHVAGYEQLDKMQTAMSGRERKLSRLSKYVYNELYNKFLYIYYNILNNVDISNSLLEQLKDPNMSARTVIRFLNESKFYDLKFALDLAYKVERGLNDIFMIKNQYSLYEIDAAHKNLNNTYEALLKEIRNEEYKIYYPDPEYDHFNFLNRG